MQVEMKVNDKSVQAEISEEQLKKMGIFEPLKELGLVEDKPKTGYERGEECNDEYYYLVDVDSEVKRIKKTHSTLDRDCYDTGNYYSNQTIAKSNARADMLFRRLRQWQAQNDKPISEKDWNDESKKKWFVAYSYGAEKLYADYYYIMRLPNTIHFATKEKAEEAIEVFRDELIWYFVEYQQRLDEE